MGRALSAVHHKDSPLPMDDLGDLPNGVHPPDDVGDLGHRHQLRPVTDRFLHPVQVKPPVRLAL